MLTTPKLTWLRDPRIAASQDTIAEALLGDYRPEHLFALRQSLQAYRQYQNWIAECDRDIERYLTKLEGRLLTHQKPLARPKDRHKARRNEPCFDVRSHLYRIFGVDLTEVPGVSTLTAYALLTGVGPDLHNFGSAT